MQEESLVTDAIRELVGRRTALEPQTVTRRAVRKAMDLYLGHQRGAPDVGEPAPGFVIAALELGGDQEEFPALLPNSMLISNEWQWERRLIVGETLRSEAVVADINERFGGRFGYNVTVRREIVLTGADGVVAARSVNTMMQYDARNARGANDE